MLVIVSLVSLVSLVLLSATHVFANVTDHTSIGGELRPLQETQIKLQYEEIRFECDSVNVLVKTTCRFNNPGPAATIPVAFILRGVLVPGDNGLVVSDPAVSNFKVSVNGEEVQVETQRFSDVPEKDAPLDHEATYGYVFNARFTSGINTIALTYNQKYTFTPENPFHSLLLTHDLITGANWLEGKVDTLQIKASFAGISVLAVNQLGDDVENGKWRATENSVELKHKEPYYSERQEFWVTTGSVTCVAYEFEPAKQFTIELVSARPIISSDLYTERSGATSYRTLGVVERINSWRRLPKDFVVVLLNARQEYDLWYQSEYYNRPDKDPVIALLRSMLR